MIKLKRADIINYRSCLDTRLPINDTLTALIGINGVGKTSLLNSLMLARNITVRRGYLQEEYSFDATTIIKLYFEIDKIEFQFKLEILHDIGPHNLDEVEAYTAFYKISSSRHWIKLNLTHVDYAIKTRDNPSDNSAFNRIRAQSFFKSVDFKLKDEILDTIKYLRNISYYSASQFSDPSKCSISFELDESKPSRYGRGNPHDKFILDLYDVYKNNATLYKRFLSTVNEDGIGLIEAINFFDHEIPNLTYEVKSGGRIDRVERFKYIVVPSFIIDGFPLSPSQLSDGTFKTLALVFYILTDKSSLLLIEEPEVGVHHGLLTSIIELIKNQSKSKQIIISTHSDYILDKLTPENVVLVEKEKESGTKSRALSSAMSKDDYRALKDYLENSGNLGEYWKESGFGYE
ncbi:MAG: ATP-binding protein [Flavobacteriales bacterium]|nr:MAG: ATP-binding protein [Flavobacteriales bacterium]